MKHTYIATLELLTLRERKREREAKEQLTDRGNDKRGVWGERERRIVACQQGNFSSSLGWISVTQLLYKLVLYLTFIKLYRNLVII